MSRKLGTTAQQALGREPGKALAAIRRLRQELDEIEEAQVSNALSRGWSWARIGRALGVSRQAVHRKYSRCSAAPLAWSGPVLASNLKVAIVVARTEAAARGDALVGTEHLLLGLLQQGEGSAADALRAAGASLRTMRAAVDVLAPTDLCKVNPSQISMTSHASDAVERAALMALREGSERVTEEHLLRVLLHSGNCGALATLEATGVSCDCVEATLDAAASPSATKKRRRRAPRNALTV
jgi:hypothetical protein